MVLIILIKASNKHVHFTILPVGVSEGGLVGIGDGCPEGDSVGSHVGSTHVTRSGSLQSLIVTSNTKSSGQETVFEGLPPRQM